PEGFWLVDDTINVHCHPADLRKEVQPTDDHPFGLPHQPRRITKRLHHSTGLDPGPVRPARPFARWLHLCSRTASVCARVHTYVKACRSRGHFPCGTRTSLRPTSSEDVTTWMFSSPAGAHRHETQ